MAEYPPEIAIWLRAHAPNRRTEMDADNLGAEPTSNPRSSIQLIRIDMVCLAFRAATRFDRGCISAMFGGIPVNATSCVRPLVSSQTTTATRQILDPGGLYKRSFSCRPHRK